MEFDIAEDFFRYFISCQTVQRYKHGLGEREGHEFLDNGIMVADEGHEILRRRAESEGDGQFKQKPYMEIAEIRRDGIQEHDVLAGPFVEALLIRPLLYHAVQHLAYEHGHGILEHVAAYARQRESGRETARCV